MRSRYPALAVRMLAFMLALGMLGPIARAQSAKTDPTPLPGHNQSDSRPYDSKLLRLAEILGAVHYLRALCGADEGQLWRNQMRALIAAEGTSARRRAVLVQSFNKGYRGYGQTYRSCTRLALLAVERFMREGASLSKEILRNKG